MLNSSESIRCLSQWYLTVINLQNWLVLVNTFILLIGSIFVYKLHILCLQKRLVDHSGWHTPGTGGVLWVNNSSWVIKMVSSSEHSMFCFDTSYTFKYSPNMKSRKKHDIHTDSYTYIKSWTYWVIQKSLIGLDFN